jgi:hypothetical protein
VPAATFFHRPGDTGASCWCSESNEREANPRWSETERGMWRLIATDEWIDVTLVVDACQVDRPAVSKPVAACGCVVCRVRVSQMSLFAMPVSSCGGRHALGCVAVVVTYPFVARCARQRYPEKTLRTSIMQFLFRSRRAAAAALEGSCHF